MNEEEKDKLKAILLDLAAEIGEVNHPSTEDRWFSEISEAIRDI
jgi:hypothetical protein